MKNKMSLNVSQPLKKTNLFVMILLSFFSLGFYMSVWWLKRKDDIRQLSEKNYIPFGWWKFFALGLFMFLLLNILRAFIFTDYGFLVIESFDTIFTFFFIGLLNYSSFRLAETLESKTDIRFNRILLTLFNLFYIQFKVNKEHKLQTT
ncbi:DUF4234 domain-containing protein [Paenisporosarcina indica]|uniref:DUF4234 domain-containing protein n=1 Tax=Paenisporosarcina indica TaxID=650093 RepID=UPI00094FF26A